MTDFWNSRYQASEFAYGTAPNNFFRDCIHRFKLEGSIILPADGEGRNAVYAAQQGLDVYAFDTSQNGQSKALQLADTHNVSIRYDVLDWTELKPPATQYDCAALIFAHIPLDIQRLCHKKIVDSLRPGGMLIFEAFSTTHLELRAKNPKVGGPGVLKMLFAESDITSDFSDFDDIEFGEFEVELQEGTCHQGVGKVLRFVGQKPLA